jgi:hypothetical protein
MIGSRNKQNASVAELVDALDSKSCTFGCAGSIPARGTKNQSEKQSESVVTNSGFFLTPHSVSRFQKKFLV